MKMEAFKAHQTKSIYSEQCLTQGRIGVLLLAQRGEGGVVWLS